jgi:hypothetical protein
LIENNKCDRTTAPRGATGIASVWALLFDWTPVIFFLIVADFGDGATAATAEIYKKITTAHRLLYAAVFSDLALQVSRGSDLTIEAL